MVPDNEIVVTKLENKCNFISIFFVLMHFTGQKKKSNGVVHSVIRKIRKKDQNLCALVKENILQVIITSDSEEIVINFSFIF